MRRFPAMASAIGELVASDHRPFAIFGQSAGGRLAIHVASYLQDIDVRPKRVFLSGASMTVPCSRFLHQLSRDQFIDAVGERFGALPAEITGDPEVWSLFERPLRADLEAYETDDAPPRRLQVPLSLIHGNRDHVVDIGEQRHWQMWSAYPIQYEVVDADHFSYRKQPKIYLEIIAAHLNLSAVPGSPAG
jgi:surfactin synthase thioesterase subunit